MVYKKLLFYILLSFIILLPNLVYAQSDFSLDFNVDYNFDENGNALVMQRITLRNLNSDTYPSAYIVDLPEDSSEIAVVNENGTLENTLLHEGGRKMIRISLPDFNVGYQEKTTILLSYSTRSLAQKTDTSWHIEIPPFSTDEHIVSYETRVSAPESWGIAGFVSPESTTPNMWNLHERGEKSISMVFGETKPETTQTSKSTSDNKYIVLIGIVLGVVIAVTIYIFSSKKFRAKSR